MSWSRRVILLVLCGAIVRAAAASIQAATFAGVPVTSGATVQAEVPLSETEKSYAAEGGNAVPAHAVAVLAVPAGFDPRKSWPVLVVFSTSDSKRLNRDDLADFYRETALAKGWLVLAGDGPMTAQQDSSGWRAAMTLAALDALHRGFPGARDWPVACAGFSGGAKRAALLAPLLQLAGCRLAGVFLTGMNEDRLSKGYREFKPGADFLSTRIFISTGSADNVARPADQAAVIASMQRTGFSRIRQETFPGGHEVNRAHVAAALRWFRM